MVVSVWPKKYTMGGTVPCPCHECGDVGVPFILAWLYMVETALLSNKHPICDFTLMISGSPCIMLL